MSLPPDLGHAGKHLEVSLGRHGFPPTSRRSNELALALNVLGTAIGQAGTVYVSAPITTGRRFADWYSTYGKSINSSEQYRDEHHKQVVVPNWLAAKPIVSRLRASGRVVVDPTALEGTPGWEQDDYRDLWGRFIERYATTVVFVEGWEYSSGCAYEFLVALRSGIRAETAAGTAITVADGLRMIDDAITVLSSLGCQSDFLTSVRHALYEMRGPTLPTPHP